MNKPKTVASVQSTSRPFACDALCIRNDVPSALHMPRGCAEVACAPTAAASSASTILELTESSKSATYCILVFAEFIGALASVFLIHGAGRTVHDPIIQTLGELLSDVFDLGLSLWKRVLAP